MSLTINKGYFKRAEGERNFMCPFCVLISEQIPPFCFVFRH